MSRISIKRQLALAVACALALGVSCTTANSWIRNINNINNINQQALLVDAQGAHVMSGVGFAGTTVAARPLRGPDLPP